MSLPNDGHDASSQDRLARYRDHFPDPTRGSFIERVRTGARYAWRGQKMALIEPALRRRALWLIAINMLVFLGPLMIGQMLVDSLEQSMLEGTGEATAGSLGSSIVQWLTDSGKRALVFVVSVLWFVVSFFFSLIVGRLFIAVLLDRFAATTEAIFFRRPESRFPILVSFMSAIREIFVELTLLVVQLPMLLGLWLLSVIPVVGFPVALVLGYAWTCMWLALAMLAPVISRHGHGAFRRMRLLGHNKALCLGLGAIACVAPIVLVPLLLPGMTVGATKLFLALASHDHIASDLSPEDKERLGTSATGDATPP